MKVEIKDCEGIKKEIIFEIPADKVADKLKEAYDELKKTVNVKGFRKGKIPKQLLRVHFHKTVEKDVLEDLITEYYKEALKEADISPVGQPQILEEPKIEEGAPLSIKMELEVKPKIEVKDYKGIELKRESIVIGDEDINLTLEALRNENAVFVVVDGRSVQKGDTVILDYDAHYNEKQMKKDGACIDLAKDPIFEEKLVGMNKGEEKNFEVDLPDNYQVRDLRGKRVAFKVKLKEIKEKKLPDLDDEFAKDIGDYENMKALKEVITDKLTKEREFEEEQRLESTLIDMVIEKNPIEDNLIEPIVNYQLDALAKNFPLSKEEIREKFTEKAKKDIKATIILEQIAKKENITVDEDEFDYEIVNRARELKLDYQKVKEKLDQSSEAEEELRSEIMVRKTIAALLDQAKVSDGSATGNESNESSEDSEGNEIIKCDENNEPEEEEVTGE